MAVTRVVRGSRWSEQAESPEGLHWNIGFVSPIAHARHRRRLRGANHSFAKVTLVLICFARYGFSIGMMQVLQRLCRPIHSCPGIRIDGEPVGPVGIVFKLRRRKQAIFSRMLFMALGLLRRAALLCDPIDRLLHV